MAPVVDVLNVVEIATVDVDVVVDTSVGSVDVGSIVDEVLVISVVDVTTGGVVGRGVRPSNGLVRLTLGTVVGRDNVGISDGNIVGTILRGPDGETEGTALEKALGPLLGSEKLGNSVGV